MGRLSGAGGWLLATLLCAGCAAIGPGGGSRVGGLGGLRADDEVHVGAMTHTLAIAAGHDLVYLVSPEAIARWRPIAQRWEVPRPAPLLLAAEGIHSAAVDPLDQSLWVAGPRRWFQYQPLTDRWSDGPLPGDVVEVVAPAPMDPAGIWFRRRGGGWLLMPRGGATPVAARPSAPLPAAVSVTELLQREPSLQIYAAEMLTGPGLAPGRVTAVARAADGRGWYLGTTSRGAWWVDGTGMRPTPLTQGLAGSVVGALVQQDGRLWVATERDAEHLPHLTRLTEDFGQVEHLPGPRATVLPFRTVQRMLATADGLWLATDQGVVHLDPQAGVPTQWGRAHRLPDHRVLSLAQYRGAILVGTWEGLAAIDSTGAVTRIDPDYRRPIHALHAQGDSLLWLGTADGLMVQAGAASRLQPAAGVGVLGGLADVLAVGALHDTIVAVGTRQVAWRDPATGGWTTTPVVGLPEVRHAAMGHGSVWLADERRVVSQPLQGGSGAAYTLSASPGGVITALLPTAEWLWLGTTAGLVRLRWR